MHHDRDSVATVVQMQSAEEQSAAVDRSTKGLVSTFQVALPEGSVALTIRHRSITVEVRVARTQILRSSSALTLRSTHSPRRQSCFV